MKLTTVGLLAVLLLAAGCSTTPPQPPKCDGSDRHPINTVRQSAALATPADKCSRG